MVSKLLLTDIIISTSDQVCYPIYKNMMFVSEVTERMTVTKAETKKIAATPILYEYSFFDCVYQTLCSIVRKEFSLLC